MQTNHKYQDPNESTPRALDSNDKKCIYKTKAWTLKELFNSQLSNFQRKDQMVDQFQTSGPQQDHPQMEKLKEKFVNIEGLLEALQTEIETGIIGDERDLKRRQEYFGKNDKPQSPIPQLKDSVYDAVTSNMVITVAVCALLSIVTGMIAGPATGWQEGVSVLIALAIQITIEVYIDLQKDRKLVSLQSKIKDDYLPVLRGKEGAIQTVNVWDLQVGDMVNLSEGCKVPADCIVVDQSAGLSVRQPRRNPQDDAKNADDDDDSDDEPAIEVDELDKDVEVDPFLWADSYILEGQCKAVVVCVGDHSSRPKKEPKLNVRKTPLEEKMNKIYLSVLFMSAIAILVIVIVGIIVQIVFLGTTSSEDASGTDALARIMETLTLGLILLIVSIPEGLPMVITISLAFSVTRMLNKDHLLIKEMSAPEILGEVNEIICGKTGTLTTEDMEVKHFFAKGMEIINSRKTTLLNCQLPDSMVDLIKESIVFNATCHIEMTDDSLYQPVGNGTDVSLFKWLQGADIPVHDIIKMKYDEVGEVPQLSKRLRNEFPFDTRRKCATTVMLKGEKPTQARVLVKGAPDRVLAMCSKHFVEGQSEPQQMTNLDKDVLGDKIKKMGEKGLRAIVFAFKDMDQMVGDDREQFENDLTFIMAVFLQDPLREKIPEIIQFVKYGKSTEQMRKDKADGKESFPHVTVRLVSGDSKETAMNLAQEAGILDKPEGHSKGLLLELAADKVDKQVMTAEEFKIAIGGVTEEKQDDDTMQYVANDQERFNDVAEQVMVIARANPEDKQLVANCLRAGGKKVVVVGDGMNDVNAICQADVGFAMGDGRTMARDAAKMILATNEFFSLARALMWGRNIYTNVRRFVQFQFTCNLSTLVTVFMGYLYLFESPINAIMLLWINLIMDTLAALALSTTPPFTNIMREGPVKGETQIIPAVVYRQIYGMTLWNVIVMAIVIFAGAGMYGCSYEKTAKVDAAFSCGLDDPVDCEYTGANGKQRHYTIIFQTFVFLQFFNFINCRMVGPKEYNVFTRFFSNWSFIMILLVVLGIQWCSQIFPLSYLFSTCRLTPKEFWSTVVLGSTALLGSIFIKLTPESWIKKMPGKLQMDEEKAVGGESFITKQIQKAGETKKDRDKKKRGEGSAVEVPVPGDEDDYHNAEHLHESAEAGEQHEGFGQGSFNFHDDEKNRN